MTKKLIEEIRDKVDEIEKDLNLDKNALRQTAIRLILRDLEVLKETVRRCLMEAVFREYDESRGRVV